MNHLSPTPGLGYVVWITLCVVVTESLIWLKLLPQETSKRKEKSSFAALVKAAAEEDGA